MATECLSWNLNPCLSRPKFRDLSIKLFITKSCAVTIRKAWVFWDPQNTPHPPLQSIPVTLFQNLISSFIFTASLTFKLSLSHAHFLAPQFLHSQGWNIVLPSLLVPGGLFRSTMPLVTFFKNSSFHGLRILKCLWGICVLTDLRPAPHPLPSPNPRSLLQAGQRCRKPESASMRLLRESPSNLNFLVLVIIPGCWAPPSGSKGEKRQTGFDAVLNTHPPPASFPSAAFAFQPSSLFLEWFILPTMIGLFAP